MADQMTDEERDRWIRTVADKAIIARDGGDMDALRLCVLGHGVECPDPACVVAYSPPTA